MSLFRNKYRAESTRLKFWDYSSVGYYFVTICTNNRVCYLGNVINDEMELSSMGKIIADEWLKTPKIRPNIDLDEWIIMPNHLHGIIVITRPHPMAKKMAGGRMAGGMVETPRRGVSTDTPPTPSHPTLKPNTLGSIIGQFKSITTKRIHAAGFSNFAWQSRFHDHIIRDHKSLYKIREYIMGNPSKWERDRNIAANLYM